MVKTEDQASVKVGIQVGQFGILDRNPHCQQAIEVVLVVV